MHVKPIRLKFNSTEPASTWDRISSDMLQAMSVTWSTSGEVLKGLTTRAHCSRQVGLLMNVDLLRHQQRWKDGLQELRTGFATLETQVPERLHQTKGPKRVGGKGASCKNAWVVFVRGSGQVTCGRGVNTGTTSCTRHWSTSTRWAWRL